MEADQQTNDDRPIFQKCSTYALGLGPRSANEKAVQYDLAYASEFWEEETSGNVGGAGPLLMALVDGAHMEEDRATTTASAPFSVPPLITVAMARNHQEENKLSGLASHIGRSQQASRRSTSHGETDLPRILSEALAISESTRRIKTIRMSDGTLTLKSVYALQQDILNEQSLVKLSITKMSIALEDAARIQDILVAALYQQDPCSILRSVDLSNCQLCDETAIQLANHITMLPASLQSINLSGNKITDAGAAALAKALTMRNCYLRELDLSRNKLSKAGIVSFCECVPSFHPHFKVLRLNDGEHLLPVSVYLQFVAAIEKNHGLETLTLGNEIMDGKTEAAENKAEKEMDTHLKYFWQEPAYTAATKHIRFLLRLNCSGLENFLQTTGANVQRLRNVLDTMGSDREMEACYRILRLKPDLLATLAASTN